MRVFSIIVGFSIAFLSGVVSAGAQCGEPIGDWGYGPTLSADGNGALAAFGSGRVLQVALVSDPASPMLVGSVGLGGLIETVVVDGSLVYAAVSQGGLAIVDISSPNHPEIVGTWETEGSVRGIALGDDLAYIADRGAGLVIIDVSDPTEPITLATLDIGGRFTDVALHGSLAFVADYRDGLRVIDVADPANPMLVSSVEELDDSEKIAVSDDGMMVYLTDFFEGFHAINVSDHLAPEVVGFVEVTSYALDLETSGQYLYLSNRGYGLRIYDLADPAVPFEVRQVDHDGSAHGVSIHGDLAYLANYEAGLRVVDIASPPDAEETGFIDGTGESKGVSIGGGLAYVASGNEQTILDLARPDLPDESSTTVFDGYVMRAVVDGRFVYAAGDYGGLRVIDIRNPAQPEETGFVDTFNATDVVKDGDLLYASCDNNNGIRVVDVSVPSAPTVIGALEGFWAGFINVSGDVLYAPEYNVGVHIVDVTDPTSPSVYDTMDVTDPIGRPAINGDLLFIANAGDGVRIFDISDPRTPVELGLIPEATYGFGMAAIGHLLFIADIYNGAFVFDVSHPAAPTELASTPLGTVAEGDVSSEGNLVAVAEVEGGLEFFDLGECSTESPTADFNWRPENPEAGRSVRLTDTSIGAVATRDWDFGDGAASNQRNPSHVWAEPGDYEVTLTVSGPYGSEAATRTVTIEPRIGGVPPITDPGDFSYVMAAAAHAQGLANTQWVTDAVLHNPGSTPAQAHVWFMKQGQDNTGAEGVAVPVAAGASVLVEDIVLSMFGENDTSGAILVGSDQPLLVTSRTYNDAASGTYGQFIPGRDTTTGVVEKESVNLVQLTRSEIFRTNLGVANPSSVAIQVAVSLRNAQGVEINTRSLAVPPFGFLQRTDILGIDADDAFAVVSSPTEGALFFPYASVVDNRTGDPMMVEPIVADDEVVVAASAHVSGLEDTDWRTDLEVCNFQGSQVDYRINLLRTDQSNGSPSFVTMTIDGTSCTRVEDVLDTSFSYEGSAALEIRSSSSALVVSSRTFNSTSAGTYGQCLPGFPEGDVLEAGQQGRITQLAQSNTTSTGFRTNIGFVNRSSSPTTVDVDLRTATGTSLGTLSVPLQPYEHRQINRIFRQVTAGTVTNGIAIVSTQNAGGSFVAYASVVDNASGDPVYIPAMVVED